MFLSRQRSLEALRRTLEERVAERNDVLHREIAERKQTEDTLRKSETTKTAIFAAAQESIILLDRDGVILDANEIAAKRFGRTPENFNGQNVFDLMPPDVAERRKAWLRQLFKSREPMVNEDVRAGHDFETTMCPVFDDHGRVVKAAVFAQDITERKRTEETLRRCQFELAHVSRLSTMGNMATGLAHEINQPLATIVSYTQGCIRRLRSGNQRDDDVLAAMEKVSTQALRAGEIVGRIRDFARKAEPRKTRLDVNFAIRQAADLLSAEAKANGVHVNLDLADPLPTVMADPIQIQQVIVNLAKNAIDAMNGSETPRRLVVIRTAPADENEIEIAVEDTGPGMKQVQLERAFEPFYTTTAEGLGLGLPTSQDIVEAHGGRMWAASDAGSGAVFRFTLPHANGTPHDDTDRLRG